MRFIHAADLHIDSPLRGLGRYAGAPLARLRGATRRALERLVELALDESVDFVLIAGDLYDRDWQDFHTGLFVREQLVRLGHAGIPVFIVQGNHDAQGVISRQVPWPESVRIFSSRSAETLRLEDIGVAIHGRSFPDREVPEDLVPGYPAALSGYFNIGLLHTSLTGTEGHDSYAPTTLQTLKTKGYDYWALGHVHVRQRICDEPRVVFPGNLQGRHARETGAKGCELVSVDGARIESRFVALDVVRWHHIALDVSAVPTLERLPGHLVQQFQTAIGDASDRLHVFRVLLQGETVLHALESSLPGTLAAAVQAAAQDIASTEIWIEQVQFDLRSPIDRSLLAQDSGAIGELVRSVDELTLDPTALLGFAQQTLAALLERIPTEVQTAWLDDPNAVDALRIDDATALLRLLKDAEGTLLARLNPAELHP